MAILHGNRPATVPDIRVYPVGGKNAMPSFAHERAIRMATDLLIRLLSPTHLVATNMDILLDKADWRRHLTPDLMVTLDAGELDPVYGVLRQQYRLWDEGRPPDLVIEAASTSTVGRDNAGKKEDYAAIGVREYVQIDPMGNLVPNRLAVYQLRGGTYEHIAAEDDGAFPSGVLPGYAWVRVENLLRLRDIGTGLLVPASWEAAQAAELRADAAEDAHAAAEEARVAAEDARAAADARAEAAEAEVAALRAAVARMQADSGPGRE